MKIYVTHDGRAQYAVAAKTMKEALQRFAESASPTTTAYQIRNYGNVWEVGQVKEADIISANPGVVYRQSLRFYEPWQPV